MTRKSEHSRPFTADTACVLDPDGSSARPTHLCLHPIMSWAQPTSKAADSAYCHTSPRT